MAHDPVDRNAAGLDRRRFLTVLSALGAAGTALPQLLWAQVEEGHSITKEVLAQAEKVAGLEFTDEERELMLEGVQELTQSYEAIRAVPVGNEVPPAFHFDPYPLGGRPPQGRTDFKPGAVAASERPEADADLAFSSVAELGALLRAGQLTSVELTELYLDRLRKFDPLLHLVISATEERAMEEAERADGELGRRQDRGALHGIPWGAKDLLAARGARTTWGAQPYEEQVIPMDATVVERLTEAGAVLLAKLSLGALAWGDVWFGGKTRNPWEPADGSSGSSAGSASAAAGGLAGFTIGSETWGSIVSPSTRCGATGLRPTFGRVSRHGAMALSWTMDKLGPICRTAHDCALVFRSIYGPDGHDPTVIEAPLVYRPALDPRRHRVGYVPSLFREPVDKPEGWDEESFAHDQATLEALHDMGFDLLTVELPDDLPVDALSFLLGAEAAAAFSDLTLSGRDDLLVRQVEQAWPNVFRQSRMVPAVEYIQANRVRTLLTQRMEEALGGIDVWVVPSFGGSNLLATNLTGHPAVVLPNGFRENDTPTSITFQGRLFGEGPVLEVAKAYQEESGFHLVHPDLDAALEQMEEGGEETDDVAAIELGYRRALTLA